MANEGKKIAIVAAIVGVVTGIVYLVTRKPSGGGKVMLTIVAGAGGTTNPAAGTYEFDQGAQAFVYAVPNAGYRFSHWSGDIGDKNPQQSPIDLLMTGDKTITANFEVITTTQKVHITIATTPGGHTNPPAGTYEFEVGRVMNSPSGLLAIPNSGYQFTEWAGHLNCPGGGVQNPIVCVAGEYDEGEVITAVFSPVGSNGIQLSAGWNEGLTYGGSSGTLASVMGAIMPYIQRIWCYRNGAWLMYDPADPVGSDLTMLYTGDGLNILMSQAAFWTWI
jgi:hypothetical protein